MNYLKRLRMYWRLQALTMSGFKRQLSILIARYELDAVLLTDKEVAFLESPLLAEFCKYEVTYQWYLAVTQGGGSTQAMGPVMNHADALKFLTKTRPGLAVIHIDHDRHFIFAKNLLAAN